MVCVICVNAFFFPLQELHLYPGKARLLSCRHHYHDHIPPRLLAGQKEDGDCVIKEVIYNDPYTNHTKVSFLCMYDLLVILFFKKSCLDYFTV